MSLINQVLKDLEKRHAGRDAVRGLPDSLRPLPDHPPRRTALWATLAGLIAGALVATAAWWFVLRPAATWAPPKEVPTMARPDLVPKPAAAEHVAVATSPVAQPATAAVSPAPVASLSPASLAPVAAVADSPPPAPTVARRLVHAPAAEPADPSRARTPLEVKTQRTAVPAVAHLARSEEPRQAPLPPSPASEPKPVSEAAPAEPPTSIDKQEHAVNPQERAEGEFRRGMALLQQARSADAERAFRSALAADPSAESPRQALLGLLLESGRRDEAETLLREGLQANPRQSKFAMILARLQLDRGAQDQAIETLTASLPNAQSDAEFLAMDGAVMSRAGRYREAADMYQAALRIGPNNALWNVGLGVALKADGRSRDALAAFQRAHDIGTLTPDLKAYVEQQLRDSR
jgi:MSHA biogenesis protein MshN